MMVLLHQLQMLLQFLHREQKLLYPELRLSRPEQERLDLVCLLEKESSQCLCLLVRGLWGHPCVHLECLMEASQPQMVQGPWLQFHLQETLPVNQLYLWQDQEMGFEPGLQ